MIGARLWAALALLTLSPGIAEAQSLTAASSCPADRTLAHLVAESSLIVAGRPNVADETLSPSTPGYVEIPVDVTRVLKGRAPDSEPLVIQFYSDDRPYAPSKRALIESVGSSSLLFLIGVDEGPVGFYFAGNTPLALRAGSDHAIAGTLSEIARQDEITRDWGPNPRSPHDDEVSRLIHQLGRRGGAAQRRIFERLETLGPTAVPAIIDHMDDRRRLTDPAITLTNHAADAFEGLRHYGPKQVVDALDAILNQISGQGGSIVNGGTDRARAAAIAGWRVYAHDLGCMDPR